MKKILIVNPLKVYEKDLEKLSREIKIRLIGDCHYISVKVIGGLNFDLMNPLFIMTSYFGHIMPFGFLRTLNEHRDDHEVFMDKFSIKKDEGREFSSDHDNIVLVVNYAEEEIFKIFISMNLSFSKENIEGIPCYIAEF